MKAIAGFFYVYGEDKNLYQCRAKGIFRLDGVKPLVGDLCEFSVVHEKDAEGNVEEILPRKNALVRPAVANVDQALILVAAREPDPNLLLMERFLAMMQLSHVCTALCINKADLSSPEEVKELAAPYAGAAGGVFLISAGRRGQPHPEGDAWERDFTSLCSFLRGKTTVVAGPSGVGKSTLTNALGGEVIMETGQISQKNRRGKHTTRHSQLIPLKGEDFSDTFLVDTPGFTSLYLPPMDEWELQDLYPEFSPYRGDCYFQPCLHEHEPDCAVKAALADHKIHPRRYEGYLALLEEIRGQKKY